MPTTHTRFSLGQIVATPGALEALSATGEQPARFLNRHQQADWGELCDEDKRLNDEAVAHEGEPERQGRVLSAYRLKNNVKIWVISEWDRSVTTVLLPSEY